MTFYEFAGNHPILTFFLASIAGNTVIKVFAALAGKYRVCKSCKMKEVFVSEKVES